MRKYNINEKIKEQREVKAANKANEVYFNGTSKDGDANNANSNKPINAEVMTIQIGKKDTAKAIMPKQKTTPAPKKK